MILFLKKFLKDLADKGANPKSEKVDLSEIPSVVLLILTTYLSVFDKLITFSKQLFNGQENLISILLMILSLYMSIKIISRKNLEDDNLIYFYNQLIRSISKLSFFVLIFSISFLLSRIITNYQSLPKEISGYIFCTNNKPLVNTRLEIIETNGTIKSLNRMWFTDNLGFFTIICDEKISRDSKLKIYLTYPNDFLLIDLFNSLNPQKIKSNENKYTIENCH